jgi:glycosyltransferase involved in cell wall biosynthesis
VHPWLRLAHEIVVPSRYLADVFEQHGYRVRVIPNVIDIGRFGAAAREHGGQRLLSVRNLEPIYRVDVLIDAFAILKRQYPSATLAIAGVGSREGALRQHAADVAGDGVRFIGRVEPPDMPALYASADVVVNASVVDNQPVSILEAFASGLPVVTTPTGDIAWMVRHDETGVIVADADPAAFADAIAALFDDPARAARLAERAADELQRYTWPVVGPQWHEVYAPSPKETVEKLELRT